MGIGERRICVYKVISVKSYTKKIISPNVQYDQERRLARMPVLNEEN